MNDNEFIVINNFFNEDFDINQFSNKDFELGRQNGLYLKSSLHDIPDWLSAQIEQTCKEHLLPGLMITIKDISYMDCWHIVVQSDIPEHFDPGIIEDKYILEHYRLNICLNDWIGMHIGDSSIITRKNSAILFRSDKPHSSFSDYGLPVNVLSFGFMILPTKHVIEKSNSFTEYENPLLNKAYDRCMRDLKPPSAKDNNKDSLKDSINYMNSQPLKDYYNFSHKIKTLLF